MIHELRTYTIAPGKLGEYLSLSSQVGRKIRGDRYGTLEGCWTTEFGVLNQYVHLWAYPSLDERDRLRADLHRNDGWTKEYLPRIRPLIVAQENKFLSLQRPLAPPEGRPDVPPGHERRVYELRSYRAHMGKAGEWLAHFKAILPVREKYSKNVALWQTEAGPLNEVVHLWAYDDLNHRADVRAKVLADPEWQMFLAKAAPLLAEMRSVILNPAPQSPMR